MGMLWPTGGTADDTPPLPVVTRLARAIRTSIARAKWPAGPLDESEEGHDAGGEGCLGTTMVSNRSNFVYLILLVILLMILFGGGGFYYGGPYVGGGLGTVLLIVLIVLLVRG